MVPSNRPALDLDCQKLGLCSPKDHEGRCSVSDGGARPASSEACSPKPAARRLTLPLPSSRAWGNLGAQGGMPMPGMRVHWLSVLVACSIFAACSKTGKSQNPDAGLIPTGVGYCGAGK